MNIKTDEATKARLLRARRAAELAVLEQVPAEAVRRTALAAGYGHDDRYQPLALSGHHYLRGYRTAYPTGDGNGNGHGNGHGHEGATAPTRTSVFAIQGAEEQLLESGVRILDDVHVVLRRRVDAQDEPELQAAAAR